MAGSYPDPPSWRMGYDRDGAQLYRIISGASTQLTGANLTALNNEVSGDSISSGDELVFLFPEKRDLDAIFIRSSLGPVTVTSSVNSTNGTDGTWESVGVVASAGTVSPDYRAVVSSSKLGVQAVKFTGGGNVSTIHLYGEITAGQNVDQLLLWSAVADERIHPANFDWGTTPRSSTEDRYFRVKNMSPSRSAHGITVAMEALTDSTPSTPLQHVIQKDGPFLAQQTIPNLAAGAVSEVLTLRRITPSNAALGLATFRVYANAESWS